MKKKVFSFGKNKALEIGIFKDFISLKGDIKYETTF